MQIFLQKNAVLYTKSGGINFCLISSTCQKPKSFIRKLDALYVGMV